MGGVVYQIHASVACSFGCFLMGMLNTWPSYTLDLYSHPNTTLLERPVTDMEASLVGSLPSLGAMAGSAAAGLLIDQLGRKRGGVVMMLPFAISWAIVEVSRSALPILIARFVSGVAGGACLVFAPIFISEVAEDSVRGTLASCEFLIGFYRGQNTNRTGEERVLWRFLGEAYIQQWRLLADDDEYLPTGTLLAE
ncbi:hypothetical protein JYU34_015496 [Plutella xylostella]|uniref:Major facilitator superfamily (MFS) profile domain-containing protein n=1 Tax=Plutella xylostella TaxID=51655 RepID=A0ABQ7Q7C5_PLUXY|nr:hypothetical protein JYU34_015496 [Plutella xylostella]